MKKFNVTKLVSLLVLIAVIAATAAGAYLGIAGRNTQMVTVNENGVDVERALYRQVAFIPNTLNTSWKEAIIPSAQLGGGTVYEFTAANSDLSESDFAAAAKTLRDRAVLLVGDASVSYEGNVISLVIPSDEPDTTVASVLAVPGNVTFAMYDPSTGLFGESVLTKEHVKNAGYYSDGAGYYVQIEMNAAGKKALKAFIDANPGEVLYALLDGGYFGYSSLNSASDTSLLSVTCDDWTYALTATIAASTDTLNAAVSVSNTYAAEGKLAWVLDAFIIAMFIVTVLSALLMIIRSKLTGLMSALTLCAQSVVFCLLMALIAADASWKMSLSSLVIITACQILFIGGIVLFNEKLAALKNRGLKQAVALAAKKLAKPLSMIYGMLIVLGLVIMAVYGIKPAAYLGRIIALSGLTSFVAIFGALRVMLSCLNTLKSNK
ncbi:MAG: hypothetical protein IKW00_02100 [Clostridia bacterium]|nr:hypothetical protein [Clostridia bacterium]